MTASSSAPSALRRAARILVLTTAALWTALVCWGAWTAVPRMPLDSGRDAASRAAYDAAMQGHVLKSILIGVAGLAILLGLASLLGRRRPDISADLPAPGATADVWTGPARILLMRHAEKTGDVNDIHLSKAGAKRAARLVDYIPETFGKPDFIFAAAQSKRSIRSIETMQPLAAAIGKDVRFDIEDRDFPALVAALKTESAYRGSLVIVCWHHGKLPEIAAQLGAPAGRFPETWPDKTFDLILQLDYSRGFPPAIKQIVEPF